jgi:hypothetical protein
MGVEGRRNETELVKGLYRLEVGVMGLRGLKVLLLVRKTRLVNKKLKDEKSEKGMTSEELAEVRSGGTSLEAGVTFASLGLSLLNNFRMGEKRNEDEGTRWRGEERDEMGRGIRKEVET